MMIKRSNGSKISSEAALEATIQTSHKGLDATKRLQTTAESMNRLKGSYFSYFLMFNFYYLAWALFSALISVYLIGLGFSAGEASFVVSVSFFASMLTQLMIGSMADKYGSKQVSSWMLLEQPWAVLFSCFAGPYG
ncbi:MFS transporter [Erysipelotrichaceae bacterium RD49]|nr:MFS transporter [Erysipelotrichaceae bacterium RD49]